MYKAWEILDKYRGKEIKGEWPTIPEMLRITVNNYSERKAFTTFSPEKLSLTYSESFKKIEEISKYLVSIGIQNGDKVALTGKNSPEWAIAYLAILNMGGVVVPIDYILTAKEVTELIKMSDSKAIFTEKDKYEFIKDNTGQDFNCFTLNYGSENYIFDLKTDTEVDIIQPLEEDLAAILYTSGTTGVSKGVMLSHKNITSDVFMAQGYMRLYHTDVFYALLPIHHSYTMTAVFLESVCVGAECIFGKNLVFSQIVKDFEQGKVTMFLGVPMLFNKIINGLLSGVRKKSIVLYGIIRFLMSISGFIKKSFKVNPGKKMFGFLLKKVGLQNIRICISGGGPLAPSTFKSFNQLGVDFVQGYGLTETAPILTLNPVDQYIETSVGKILPFVEMKIINKDVDGIGDVVVKGPNVMQGYYKKEEESKNMFTEDGFLITGDAGYLDNDYLYLTGRKSSLIVTEGGKNVYPEEIEDEFQLFTEHEQVLIKGYVKNSKTLSEGIEVLFYPTEEFSRDKSEQEIKNRFNEIVEEVNKRLVAYKKIEKVTILKEAMPMTTTKKIKRNEVVKMYS